MADAGAKFIVTPGTPVKLAEALAEAPIPVMPGCATASEAMTLMAIGFRALKFFPAAASGGTAWLKGVRGPLPALRFCPTGGIDLANAPSYLALPNVVCVGGTWMAPAKAIADGDFEADRSPRARGRRLAALNHSKPRPSFCLEARPDAGESMFDAKRLLDAVVGAAAQSRQPDRRSRRAAARAARTYPGSRAGRLRPAPANGEERPRRRTPVSPRRRSSASPGLSRKRKAGRVVSEASPGSAVSRLIGGLAYKAWQNPQAGKPLLDLGPRGARRAQPARRARAAFMPSTFRQAPPSIRSPRPTRTPSSTSAPWSRAAAADGIIDAAERKLIMHGLAEAGIDPTRPAGSRSASPTRRISTNSPPPRATPEKAAQIYTAAQIAIDPDTIQEREFLRRLAEALSLEPGLKARIDETAAALRA